MSHQWCKCRGTYVKGGCNVKTHWTTVGPGLRAGQADYENCTGPDYSLYQTPRNPVDFTPKAEAGRLRTIINFLIGFLIGVIIVALFF